MKTFSVIAAAAVLSWLFFGPVVTVIPALLAFGAFCAWHFYRGWREARAVPEFTGDQL